MKPLSIRRLLTVGCIVLTGLPVAASSANSIQNETIASANFEDGTLGPFAAAPAGAIKVVDDPTNRGRGKVAELRYEATKARIEPSAALNVKPPVALGLGSTFFFSGDVYFPVTTFNWSHPRVTRMLLVFRASIGDSLDDRTDSFVSMNFAGRCGISMQWSNDGKLGLTTCNLAPFELGKWHHIEMQVTMNKTPASRDGALRLWIDGKTVHEDTLVRFTDPRSTAKPVWRLWSVGEGRTSSDDGLGRDMSDDGLIAESRYWDNVALSFMRRHPR